MKVHQNSDSISNEGHVGDCISVRRDPLAKFDPTLGVDFLPGLR